MATTVQNNPFLEEEKNNKTMILPPISQRMQKTLYICLSLSFMESTSSNTCTGSFLGNYIFEVLKKKGCKQLAQKTKKYRKYRVRYFMLKSPPESLLLHADQWQNVLEAWSVLPLVSKYCCFLYWHLFLRPLSKRWCKLYIQQHPVGHRSAKNPFWILQERWQSSQ